MAKNTPSPEQTVAQNKPRNLNIWVVAVVGAALGIILINTVIWAVYVGRSYPGTRIGAMTAGNKTYDALNKQISQLASQYTLVIDVNNQEHQVKSEDIGLQYDVPASTQEVVNYGKTSWVPLYDLVRSWWMTPASLHLKLDEQKLQTLATQLAGTGSRPATDAKVVIEGEMVRVEPDQNGQGINEAALKALIKRQAAYGARQAVIRESATKAAITTEEATVMAATARKSLQVPVTIEINGKIFSPGAAEIGRWLAINPQDGVLKLTANQDAINAYVAGLAGQVDVAAVNKKISMVNGEVRNVSEGKNGLALDRAAVASSLASAITAGGDASVTGKLATVPYKTLTNNSVDISGKYIEINLSRQQMWAYDNKQVVYSSPVTSGATGAGFPTVQGLFSVKAKQTNRNLNGYAIGYNYNVFVQYWMPFYGNYGLHDASWRSSFGGGDYYYGGSHGCVNLPLATATWLYNWALVGTPVWVHS